MKAKDLKKIIEDYGRNNITGDSVLIIEDGKVRIGSNPKSVLKENEVSLNEVIFDFSRNFNERVIESILPEINILLSHDDDKKKSIDRSEGMSM